MILKHFDISTPRTEAPEDEGWLQAWHGKYEMSKCESAQRRSMYAERDRAIRRDGMMTEAEFERDCFLSILASIKRKHVSMLELGAGWGRMSLALAGVIEYKVVPITPTSYRCLAVEGDPTHCEWTREHFVRQKIHGAVVHGAVSKKTGTCYFQRVESPDACYGQTMAPLLHRSKLPNLRNLINLCTGKAIRVPMFTVDELVKRHHFNRIDIVDIDVQGAEYDVALGAEACIRNDLIDYWLIGTHHARLNEALKGLLSSRYDLLVEVYPDTVGRVGSFPPVRCHDGIQVFQRKGTFRDG